MNMSRGLSALAILCALLCFAWSRDRVDLTHRLSTGVTVRVSKPRLARSQSQIWHEGDSTRCSTDYWPACWGDGHVEYVLRGMNLTVDGRDYGELVKGDIVDIRDGLVSVNGARRDPKAEAEAEGEKGSATAPAS